MLPERRRQIFLLVLLVVLAGVFYRVWTDLYVAVPGQAASASGRDEGRQPAANAQAQAAPAVHLDELQRDRPKPANSSRDLFRFGQRSTPAPAAATGGGGRIAPAPPAPPPGPPQPPPIALKFIGIVEQGGTKPKLAILSDGLGPPLYAVEGGTVAGRYRVVRIGAESIEMEYLDGRGRQTIRLSGS